MANSMTISLAAGVVGPQRGPNGMVREDVKVTGNATVAGDETPYTCQFVKQPDRIEGPFGNGGVSGKVITFNSLGALVNGKTYYASVIGYGG